MRRTMSAGHNVLDLIGEYLRSTAYGDIHRNQVH